ncbi:hypothetical protein [Allosediminivita pacifica]|uniref:Uncharacterized protein n=1 Tax=Allosediminivita pacifica TaxID=1267769 RepID=A0A2T6AZL1_9RHOB|nr:hypothetical protein [Allosediminivita pacifica]PTX49213.1 hypothetical protein C8N44_10753 [Allosediminivita pacifica]GGB05806.1 hypothetical protein GCM10011324_14950 [Allosediminivita pacifica]
MIRVLLPLSLLAGPALAGPYDHMGGWVHGWGLMMLSPVLWLLLLGLLVVAVIRVARGSHGAQAHAASVQEQPERDARLVRGGKGA